MKCDMILAGVGGQGILSIAQIFGYAAVESGLYLKQAEVHGMSQRGGDGIAKEVNNARGMNMVIAGAASLFTGLDINVIRKGVEVIFGSKGEEIVKANLAAINAGGFIPLLAHIERYLKDDEFWLELKKKYKVFFQSSVRTLAKASFHIKKKQVIRFLEKEIIDNLGTDLHRASQLESVDKGLTFLKNNFSGYGKDLFSDKFLFENS